MKRVEKKSIVGPVISVFVLVLIISILAGLTFLFVAQLKATALTASERTAGSEVLETIAMADLITGIYVDGTSDLNANSFLITGLHNATDDAVVPSTNATITNNGWITNSSGDSIFLDGLKVNYTYSYISPENAGGYTSVNATESAGASIVGFLPLIFLAIIFGAILTIVLKIILPYINLGQSMGGF